MQVSSAIYNIVRVTCNNVNTINFKILNVIIIGMIKER